MEGPARHVHLQANALLGLLPHRQGHIDGLGQLRLALQGSFAGCGVLLDVQLKANRENYSRMRIRFMDVP